MCDGVAMSRAYQFFSFSQTAGPRAQTSGFGSYIAWTGKKSADLLFVRTAYNRRMNKIAPNAHEDTAMDEASPTTKHFELEIEAVSPKTEIWLGDDGGSLVEKAVGRLDTSVMAGDYVVEFGFGTPTYPIRLDSDLRTTEAQLTAGPTCARPVFALPPE